MLAGVVLINDYDQTIKDIVTCISQLVFLHYLNCSVKVNVLDRFYYEKHSLVKKICEIIQIF